MADAEPITGGCQCGAVRYRLAKPPTGVGICFWRMCQKSVGNYFAAHAGISEENLTWTRGEPAVFKSSEAAERGYCRDCGTPLTYVLRGSGRVSVTAGSLDDPKAFPPDRSFGQEGGCHGSTRSASSKDHVRKTRYRRPICRGLALGSIPTRTAEGAGLTHRYRPAARRASSS